MVKGNRKAKKAARDAISSTGDSYTRSLRLAREASLGECQNCFIPHSVICQAHQGPILNPAFDLSIDDLSGIPHLDLPDRYGPRTDDVAWHMKLSNAIGLPVPYAGVNYYRGDREWLYCITERDADLKRITKIIIQSIDPLDGSGKAFLLADAYEITRKWWANVPDEEIGLIETNSEIMRVDRNLLVQTVEGFRSMVHQVQ